MFEFERGDVGVPPTLPGAAGLFVDKIVTIDTNALVATLVAAALFRPELRSFEASLQSTVVDDVRPVLGPVYADLLDPLRSAGLAAVAEIAQIGLLVIVANVGD